MNDNDKGSNMQTTEPKKRRARRGRGEGSIFQRGDGLWVANVSAGFNANGKRRRRAVYGKTKREVQDKLKALGASDCNVDAGSMTVGALLVRWLETKRTDTQPATHLRYKVIVVNHLTPRIGRLRLASIAPVNVEQLYREMERDGVSPRNRQLAGVVLSNALTYAVRLKLVPHNAAREIRKPRSQRKELRTWTAADAAAFLKATEFDRLHALYVLALATGMRQGELFALEWTDVDFEAGYLTVRRSLEDLGGTLRVKEPKTGKGRRVDLPAFALDALHAHRKAMLAEGHRTAVVFVDADGGYLRRPNVLRRSFGPAMAKAEVPTIRFHDLRHTAATLLLAAGENVKVVSERLGHATTKITLDVYAHVLPTMQKSAADTMQKLLG
jgi:integrase